MLFRSVNEKFRVSVAYTNIIVDDGKVNLGGANPLTATFKQNVNIIAISGTYKM